MSHKKVVKNVSHFGLTRSLVLLSELLQIGDENVHVALKRCLKWTRGKDGGLKAGELLGKLVFGKTKGKLFLLDFSKWEVSELKKFSEWARDAVEREKNDSLVQGYIEFTDKYNLPQRVLVSLENRKETVEGSPQTKSEIVMLPAGKSVVNGKGEKAFVLMHALHTEINRIFNERTVLQVKVNEIALLLERAKAEKESIERQLTEAISSNNELSNTVRNQELEFKIKEGKLAEMDSRLRRAYIVDNHQINQELVSLKNDLAKRLRLDFKDFKVLKAKV